MNSANEFYENIDAARVIFDALINGSASDIDPKTLFRSCWIGKEAVNNANAAFREIAENPKSLDDLVLPED